MLLNVNAWLSMVLWIAAVVIVAHAYILEWRFLSGEFVWSLVGALFWVMGGIGFFMFLVNPVYQWVMIALIVIVYGVYTENVFTYHFQPHRYTPLSLPKLSYYMMIVSTLFVVSTLFALDVINSTPLWLTLVVLPLYTGFVTAALFRGYGVLERKNYWLIAIVALGSLELGWVVHYFPTSYFVAGALCAVYVYALPSILLMVARDTIEKKAAIQYGSVALLTTAAILLTSQWV